MRGYIRSVLFCLGLVPLLFSALSRAQDTSSKELRLNLSECIDMGLKNNAQIIQGRFNVTIADVQVDNARNAFLPTLSSSYGMSRHVSGPREGSFIDPATGLLVTSLTESEVSGSQSVGTNFSVSLYDPSNWATLSARKQGLKAAELNLTITRQQVAFQVKQRYFNLLQTMKLLEVQQEQIRVSEENLRRAETLYEIRSVPISDVLSARATLESTRATLIERENSVEVARSNLSFTMGLGTDVRIVPTEEEFEVKPLSLRYEKALDRALETHPSLLSQEYSMLQARDNLKATQYGVRYPTLSMSAGYNWSLATDEKFLGLEDLFLKNYGYSFSMSVSLPVFNRLSTENSVKIQKLQYLQSTEGLKQARRQTALDVKQAFLNIEQFRRSIEAHEASVRAAEENFKLAEERYNFGTGTFLERLQAQTSLFQARNNLVQAIYNYQIQLAQLEQAMGGPIAEDEGE